MNEQLVKQIVLVRAIESADRDHVVLNDDDRHIASLGARERLASVPGDPGISTQPAAAQFLAIRSGLLVNRLARRYPAFATLAGQARHLALVSILVPALSLIVGIAVDRIADPHRVDLLAAPLLVIIGWNLVVYAGMLIWLLMPSRPRNSGTLGRWLHANGNYFTRAMRHMPGQRELPGPLQAALLAFTIEWRRMSGALDAARIGRTLHLSAALFAAGAALSLYVRGLLTQYAAGWESTFLDPTQLQSILSFVFAPARTVFHMQAFSLADIERLRFTQTGTAAMGAGGARWVHLYAATLLLLVILPRLVLALLAHWRVLNLQSNFPFSLAQPYFRHLTSGLSGAEGVLDVLPYSFALDPIRIQSLQQIGGMLLGERYRVVINPSTEYGAETSAAAASMAAQDVTITAVLFNLSATPETQNHGAFLEYVAQNACAAGRQLMVLIDESGYVARIGDQAGAGARCAERVALWRSFCQLHQLRATIVDLLEPQRRRPDLEIAANLREN